MATIMHATNKIAIGDATHNRSHGVTNTEQAAQCKAGGMVGTKECGQEQHPVHPELTQAPALAKEVV